MPRVVHDAEVYRHCEQKIEKILVASTASALIEMPIATPAVPGVQDGGLAALAVIFDDLGAAMQPERHDCLVATPVETTAPIACCAPLRQAAAFGRHRYVTRATLDDAPVGRPAPLKRTAHGGRPSLETGDELGEIQESLLPTPYYC
ncbi:MAG: hypothetical protein GY769_11960 [bacterium]|nr:hypothetical protein [bacterium]